MLRTLSNKYQKDFVAAVAYFFHFEFKKIAAMIWQLFSLFYFIFSDQDYLTWTVHKALGVNKITSQKHISKLSRFIGKTSQINLYFSTFTWTGFQKANLSKSNTT